MPPVYIINLNGIVILLSTGLHSDCHYCYCFIHTKCAA